MKNWLRYLLSIGFTAALLTVLTIALCTIADPYRFFGTTPIEGSSKLKPRAYQQDDLAKSSMLARIRPVTLLLGNSRVEVGLDPESRQWPRRLRPVFNAGLAGHDLFSALLFLRDDVAIGSPNLVLLGVDFQDFIQAGINPSDPPLEEAETRMVVDRNGRANSARSLQWWRDAVTSALSIDALTDSLMTLAMQDSSSGITMTVEGFNPLRDYRAIVSREGAYSLFAQKAAAYDSQYRTFARSDFHDPQNNPEFRYLVAIANACASHRIGLIVFTYPYHERYFEMIRKVGLWPSFVAWKRALGSVLQHSALQLGSNIELFDFAQSSVYSTEPVPPSGDRRTQMRWYWEEGHFKSALGDKLIARMVGRSNEPGTLLVVNGTLKGPLPGREPTRGIAQTLGDSRSERPAGQ